MSSLQDKLYNQKQTPPPIIWDKIAAALDESHIGDEFPSKLYDVEVMPPERTWGKIADELEPAHSTVIPMQRKNSSFFRYAAAAVFIGIVIFGVIKWMNAGNDKSAGGFANAPTDSTVNSPNTAQSDRKDSIQPNDQPENKEEGSVADAGNTDQIKPRSVKRAKNNYSVSDPDPVEAIYAYNEHTPNLADRYIMYMTPDGGIVRMSKKWGNLVCCVSGQEQDPDCKDQLKKWQEKMACAPVANGNFMDILSLVNTLNTDL